MRFKVLILLIFLTISQISLAYDGDSNYEAKIAALKVNDQVEVLVTPLSVGQTFQIIKGKVLLVNRLQSNMSPFITVQVENKGYSSILTIAPYDTSYSNTSRIVFQNDMTSRLAAKTLVGRGLTDQSRNEKDQNYWVGENAVAYDLDNNNRRDSVLVKMTALQTNTQVIITDIRTIQEINKEKALGLMAVAREKAEQAYAGKYKFGSCIKAETYRSVETLNLVSQASGLLTGNPTGPKQQKEFHRGCIEGKNLNSNFEITIEDFGIAPLDQVTFN